MSGNAPTVRSVWSATSLRTRTRCCSVTSVTEASTTTVLDCPGYQWAGGTVGTAHLVRVVGLSVQRETMRKRTRTWTWNGYSRQRWMRRWNNFLDFDLTWWWLVVIEQGEEVYSHTMCRPCHIQWRKGNFCPQCNGVFGKCKYKVLARWITRHLTLASYHLPLNL